MGVKYQLKYDRYNEAEIGDEELAGLRKMREEIAIAVLNKVFPPPDALTAAKSLSVADLLRVLADKLEGKV